MTKKSEKKLLITGVAGFIGSHLLDRALGEGYRVIGIDNFLTGRMSNIDAVLSNHAEVADRFDLYRDDVRDLDKMVRLAVGCECIFHEAAIGSVPWSIQDPLLAHHTNLTGFVNILEAAKANAIKRVVYASSSAVFGDATGVPAREQAEGECLSPYASTKRSQEIYAQSYARCYGLEIIGLRYFNVFGPRQDPNGAYAAVIPKWGAAMARSESCTIYGDGSATRDYCHVSNVVEANFMAAAMKSPSEHGCSYALNIGCGAETSLVDLYQMMKAAFLKKGMPSVPEPTYVPSRLGDIERSCADISMAKRVLGFEPKISVKDGLASLILDGEFDIIP